MAILEKIKYLYEFMKILRNGEFTGDAVILKSMFGKFDPSPEISNFIKSISNVPPDFSDIDFTSMPKGSFGASYGRFMIQESLTPFRFSGKYKELMSKNYLPIFYASVHDFFHVLTGYDTSFAGEAGVWAFVAGQGISPQADRAHRMAQIGFSVAKPSQCHLIRGAGNEGFQNGKSAKLVLSMNFREEFQNSLADVRTRYKIKITEIDEIKASLESF